MRNNVVVVLLVVAVSSVLMVTANPPVPKASTPSLSTDESSSAINTSDEIFETGLFVEDGDGNPVELTNEEDFETLDKTVEDIATLVSFHLYTRENPNNSQILVPGDADGLRNTNWNPDRLTRIVTHGWQSSGTKEVCTSIRDAYLQHGDHNVIVVDWSRIASSINYGYAARRVGIVGAYIGAMLIDFLESDGMNVSQLVVEGDSLGAHVAGLGSRFAKNTVGYVVALDPAGPLFEFAGPGHRVDKSDASNVQVIHTNQGRLVLSKNVGHMDFHPNGGTRRGCDSGLTSCPHVRAYELFAESINTQVGFYGQLCNSWSEWQAKGCSKVPAVRMGGETPVPIASSGSYYLMTASSKPYALGPP